MRPDENNADETSRSNHASPPAGGAGSNDRWIVPGICVFLALVVWAVFGQTLHHEFVNYDDDENVYANPNIVSGLT